MNSTKITGSGFYFEPKKWLGDSSILEMDWDVRGMHIHLMALAWQNKIQAHIKYDEGKLKKILGNPNKEDWERILPQLLNAWSIVKIDGENYLTQQGLLKNENVKKPRKKKVKEEIEFLGFSIKKFLEDKSIDSIFNEDGPVVKSEERQTIWTIGVDLLKEQNKTEGVARAFLAKLIKQYSEKEVIEAIVKVSLKKEIPMDVQSYLVGILNQTRKKNKLETDEEKKNKQRGRVSI